MFVYKINHSTAPFKVIFLKNNLILCQSYDKIVICCLLLSHHFQKYKNIKYFCFAFDNAKIISITLVSEHYNFVVKLINLF
jgi:hypothetical protein